MSKEISAEERAYRKRFSRVVRHSQAFKALFRSSWGWEAMDYEQQESLDKIAYSLAVIVNGGDYELANLEHIWGSIRHTAAMMEDLALEYCRARNAPAVDMKEFLQKRAAKV